MPYVPLPNLATDLARRLIDKDWLEQVLENIRSISERDALLPSNAIAIIGPAHGVKSIRLGTPGALLVGDETQPPSILRRGANDTLLLATDDMLFWSPVDRTSQVMVTIRNYYLEA